MKQKNILFLFLIFILALFLRIYKFSEYPVSLTIDEANIGDNAYSILKTGHDEWGKFIPLAFKSVGDYKPPVNIYLTIPSIWLFGLSEFAVRFPIALFGSLTVFSIYFLLKNLDFKTNESLFGAFWLSISPWHINFSRASFEAVLALFFLVTGVSFFISSTKNKSFKKFLLSLTFFSLSVWSYHSNRLFTPILFVFLLFLYKKKMQFLIESKKLLISAILLSFFALPFIYLTIFTPAISTRALSTSIFRDPSLLSVLHNGKYKNISEFIFNNDIYLIFRHFLGKYLNYFNFSFFFRKGMGFTPQGYLDSGIFYLTDILLFPIGLYSLFISKNKKLKIITFFWLFSGPIPASFTMNEQHTLRSLIWLPAFAILAASSLRFIKKKYLYFLYLPILVLNFAYVSDLYLRQYPRFFSEFWQFGYKDAAIYACQNKDKYNEIIITDTHGSESPTITSIPYSYVLFYCKLNPKDFQTTRKIDKFTFRRPDWKNDQLKSNILMISSIWDTKYIDIPQENIIKTEKYLNGFPSFVYLETNKK